MMNFKCKPTLLVALMAAAFAGQAMSTPVVSTKTLQVTWAGVVPVSPLATGEWRFVNIADPTQDFVPTTGTINVRPIANGAHSFQTSDVAFGIQAKQGEFFTDASTITAYLASAVGFQGLTPTDASAVPNITLNANGTPLTVGPGAPVTLASVSGSSTDFVPVTLSGSGSLPDRSFTAGDNFSAHATVMFTASVGS